MVKTVRHNSIEEPLLKQRDLRDKSPRPDMIPVDRAENKSLQSDRASKKTTPQEKKKGAV